jgi:hypothetical protein
MIVKLDGLKYKKEVNFIDYLRVFLSFERVVMLYFSVICSVLRQLADITVAAQITQIRVVWRD